MPLSTAAASGKCLDVLIDIGRICGLQTVSFLIFLTHISVYKLNRLTYNTKLKTKGNLLKKEKRKQ